MNVGLVLPTNFPEAQAIHAQKIAKSLANDGHEVHVFARNTERESHSGATHDDPPLERLSFATVHRFSCFFPGTAHDLLTAPLPSNPLWVGWLARHFQRAEIDVVVLEDIRLGVPTAIAARLVDIPLVAVLLENYGEWARLLPRESLMDHITFNPHIVGAIERIVIQLADEVWVVVEERRQELVARGISEEKLRVVSNTPYLGKHREKEADPAKFDWDGFTFGYLGLLDEFRNLQLVIEALPDAVAEEPNIHLAIGGEGPHRSALEQRAEALGVTDHVTFTGWVDPDDATAFLRACDAGVIPHEPNAFTDTTVPNKLFDYMAAGLPVLATDSAPIARIVAETNCGITVPRPATPTQFASAMCDLYRSAESAEYGMNGWREIREKYNWEHESEVVSESLTTLVGS